MIDLNEMQRQFEEALPRHCWPKMESFRSENELLLFGCKWHGEWVAKPDEVIGQEVGCPSCRPDGREAERRAQVFHRLDRALPGGVIYARQSYAGIGELMTFFCREHGVWRNEPSRVLSGIGCPKCSVSRRAEKNTTPADEAHRRLVAAMPSHCRPVMSSYLRMGACMKFCCDEHGVWVTTPFNVLNGSGCPRCASYGFDANKSACVYLIKFKKDGVDYWKVGVTSRTIHQRFVWSDRRHISDYAAVYFDSGRDAWAVESQIKAAARPWVVHEPVLTSGNTEIFTVDISDLFDLYATRGRVLSGNELVAFMRADT